MIETIPLSIPKGTKTRITCTYDDRTKDMVTGLRRRRDVLLSEARRRHRERVLAERLRPFGLHDRAAAPKILAGETD